MRGQEGTKWLSRFGILLGLALFLTALWVLHHTLHRYSWQEVSAHLRAISTLRLFGAAGLTLLSYLVLSGYDALAFYFIGQRLPYRKIAFASFIGYAFSNNTGSFAVLASGGVRLRLYARWGLSTLEITQVVGFCLGSFWLGFFFLGGIVFLLVPLPLPPFLHAPFASARPLGWGFLALVAGYVLWARLHSGSLRIAGRSIPLPSLGVSLVQIVLSSLDWTLAGTVLFSLLPSGVPISYAGFLGIFLLGQVAGLLSLVPGGLGVFESVIILLLGHVLSPSATVGALLLYRLFYYLLPLLLAALLMGMHELHARRGRRP